MDLQKIIEAETEKLIASGKIEAMIAEDLENLMSEVVRESLNSYSDFGKSLRKKVNETLVVDLDKLTLPEYQGMMLSFIKAELDRVMIKDVKENAGNLVKKFLQPLEKYEYSLEEIAEKFQQECKGNNDIVGEECTIITDWDGGDFTYLCLDEEAGKGKYTCKYRIGIYNNKVFNLNIGDDDMSNYKGSCIYGFDRFLFQLFTADAKITTDEFDIDDYTYIGMDEY